MKIIHLPTSHFESRPERSSIDTVIVHSMRCPWNKGRSPLKSCLKLLKLYKVSAHYIITRSGRVVQLVPPRYKAWHAGESRLPFPDDQRESVNAFSVGIELLEATGRPFTSLQYLALAALIKRLSRKHRIKNVLGHEHVAPGRKNDPGKHFDWKKLTELLDSGIRLPLPTP